jgi:hypothetical protein
MMLKISLDSIVKVDRIRSDSLNCFKFVASNKELKILATRFKFIDVLELSAELIIRKSARDCWDVVGQLRCCCSGL